MKLGPITYVGKFGLDFFFMISLDDSSELVNLKSGIRGDGKLVGL